LGSGSLTCKVDLPKELEQNVSVDGVHLVAEAEVLEAADVLVHVPARPEVNDKSDLWQRFFEKLLLYLLRKGRGSNGAETFFQTHRIPTDISPTD